MIVQNGSAILVAILAGEHVRRARRSSIATLVVHAPATSCFVEATSKTFAIQQTDRVALALSPLVFFLGRVLAWPTRGPDRARERPHAGQGDQGRARSSPRTSIRSMAEVGSEEGSDRGGGEGADPLDLRVRRHDRARGDGAATRHHRDRGRQDAPRRAGAGAHSTATRRIPVYATRTSTTWSGSSSPRTCSRRCTRASTTCRSSEIVRAAHFVPESKKVGRPAARDAAEKFHIALVTDEYGSRDRPRHARGPARGARGRDHRRVRPRGARDRAGGGRRATA